MWYYVKTLEYPINLRCNDLRMAKYLMSQYGGPDGELSAALRYLNQDIQCQLVNQEHY